MFTLDKLNTKKNYDLFLYMQKFYMRIKLNLLIKMTNRVSLRHARMVQHHSLDEARIYISNKEGEILDAPLCAETQFSLSIHD